MARKKKEPIELYTQYDLKLMVEKIYRELSSGLQPHLTEESGAILNEMEVAHLAAIGELAEATAEQICKSLQDKDKEFIEVATAEWRLDESQMIDELELCGHVVIKSPSIPELYKIDSLMADIATNPYQLQLI